MNRDIFVEAPGKTGSRARLGEMEAAGLSALAQMEGVRLSEAVRLAIREACKNRGLWPPQGPTGTAPAGGVPC